MRGNMSKMERTGPKWGYGELRRAIDAAGVAMWAWNIETDDIAMDPKGYELWEVPKKQAITFEHLSDRIHPHDQERVRAAFAATRAIVGPYEIDFRTMVKTDIRWISARGQGSDTTVTDTVKPEVRLTSGRFLDEMAGVAHWVERKGFASSVRLLTEADLDPIEMHNAQLLSGLEDDDAEAVAVARDVACRINGAVRLNDLTIQTGLVERGYRALLLLLGIGDLRTAHRERIRPHTLVQWKGSRQ